MILVLGSVTAKDGFLAEALALSQEHVTRSRTEPGCITHAVYEDAENAQRLVFVEQWTDQAVLWAHFNVPESKSFAKAIAALAAEKPLMTIYDAAPLQMPETK